MERINIMIRYGTAYFFTFKSTINYYRPYFETSQETKEGVKEKIKNKEIFLGKPKTKEGERLYLDRDGRYHIETEDN